MPNSRAADSAVNTSAALAHQLDTATRLSSETARKKATRTARWARDRAVAADAEAGAKVPGRPFGTCWWACSSRRLLLLRKPPAAVAACPVAPAHEPSLPPAVVADLSRRSDALPLLVAPRCCTAVGAPVTRYSPANTAPRGHRAKQGKILEGTLTDGKPWPVIACSHVLCQRWQVV